MSGVTMSLTRALTTAVNAAPTTTATARSTRFPRRMNCRNSLSMGRIITLAPDGSVALLRRHRRLDAVGATWAAGAAGAPRWRHDPVRLRRGDPAPAHPQRRAGGPDARVPHALPRRPLARPAGDAQVLRAAGPRPATHRPGPARHGTAARRGALRLRAAELPVRGARPGAGRDRALGGLVRRPVPGRAPRPRGGGLRDRRRPAAGALRRRA